MDRNPGQPDSRGRTDTCETCRFFEAHKEATVLAVPSCTWGFCHRYPPRAGNGEADYLDFDRYPRVEEVNFCGEHQAAYGHGV